MGQHNFHAPFDKTAHQLGSPIYFGTHDVLAPRKQCYHYGYPYVNILQLNTAHAIQKVIMCTIAKKHLWGYPAHSKTTLFAKIPMYTICRIVMRHFSNQENHSIVLQLPYIVKSTLLRHYFPASTPPVESSLSSIIFDDVEEHDSKDNFFCGETDSKMHLSM